MTGEEAMRAPLAARVDGLARLGEATADRVVAVEIVGLAQVSLRLDPSEAARAPFPLPTDPNTVTGDLERGVLWLGPDEWLVVGVSGSASEIVEELEASLGGVHHSTVDVSADRAVIELTGSGRHELLSFGCPIDLHPRSWGPGRCAQTLYGRAPVLLQELAEATRVFVRPSFGGYVVDRLLADADPTA